MTKYEKIIFYFKNEFENNKIKIGEQVPTEKEISEKFQVSRITSKRAIDELVLEGLVERTRGKGSFFRGFPSKKKVQNKINENKIIAIVFDMPLAFGMDYIRGASKYLNEKGYILTSHFIGEDNQREEKLLLKKLKNKELAGVIVYPHRIRLQFEFFLTCYLEKIPIVTIDQKIDCFPIDAVISDNYQGGYLVAEHLIKQGNKKIGQIYCEYPYLVSSVMERMQGNLDAFNDFGIKVESNKIFYEMKTSILDENLKLRLKTYLHELKSENYTAIICENDVVAKKILEINSEFVIAGFDNLKKLGLMDVTWLTVEQDFEKIGYEAANLIIKRIEEPNEKVNIKKIEITLLNGRKENNQ